MRCQHTVTTTALLALLCWVPACDDDDQPASDAGVDSWGYDCSCAADGLPFSDWPADLTADQGPQDQGPQDQGAQDQGTADEGPGDQGPSPDVAPAGPLSPFTLAADFKTLYRFDDPTSAGATAFNLQGSTLFLFEAGGTPMTGTVSQATIDSITGLPGALTTVFSFQVSSSATIYPGEYVALSPKPNAAVGYTDATFAGAIYWGDKGIKTPKVVADASGNWDAIFLDDTTLLINGTGVGSVQQGQGIYLYQEGKTPRRLITDMGSASGFMALGQNTVYAGGYFTTDSKVFGYSLAEVKAAISGGTTLSSTTDGDLIFTGAQGGAATLGDDLVIVKLDSSWAYDKVVRIPVTVSGDALSPGSETDLVSGGAGATVAKVAGGGSGPLGLMLKDGSKTEIAVIGKK